MSKSRKKLKPNEGNPQERGESSDTSICERDTSGKNDDVVTTLKGVINEIAQIVEVAVDMGGREDKTVGEVERLETISQQIVQKLKTKRIRITDKNQTNNQNKNKSKMKIIDGDRLQEMYKKNFVEFINLTFSIEDKLSVPIPT